MINPLLRLPPISSLQAHTSLERQTPVQAHTSLDKAVPHENDYLEVPYADLRQPPVSLWEAEAAARHLRMCGRKSINPALLIETIEKQRELVRSAQTTTRKMRRKQQAAHRQSATGIDPLQDQYAPPTEDPIDWSQPAKPFDGEIW